MSKINTKCRFCESETDEKVLPFNKNSLEKCRDILIIRIKCNLKYAHIKLPNDCNSTAAYHLSCYRKFTAVKKTVISTPDTDSVSVQTIETSDNQPEVSLSPSPSTSHQKTICLFCDHHRKQTNKKFEKIHCLQSNETREKILTKSLASNEVKLHNKISQTSVSLFYHNSCMKDYLRRTDKISDGQSMERDSVWHATRVSHKNALQKLNEFINDDIIQGNNIHLMSNLHEKYESNNECNITCFRLEQKIRASFDRSVLTIEEINGKKLVFRTGLPMDFVMSKQKELVKRDILTSAANILRKDILSLPITPLPTTCSVQELLKGECNIPDSLKQFNLELLGIGSSSKKKFSESCLKKAESISQDQIYAVTNGHVKPSKQLALGMTIKSLTNSRKVVNILNKYGQIPSYTLLEELETEITYASMDESVTTSIPSGIIPCPQLNTGVAFDNFDRYVDTSSGKNTLHDTVGIIFQNEEVEEQYSIRNQPMDLSNKPSKGKRRRAFDVIDINIDHPIKKPRMNDTMILLDNDLRKTTETVTLNAVNRDLLWVLCHAAGIENTPMWVGFNNITMNDNTSKQKIAYLNPINMSPTNTSVVKTTMQEAKNIAQECGQEYICVTYDLAIAKVALQIQSSERPHFDNLFIFLGTFHIILAYFKAIGKFIDDCGMTHLLIEADLLANGSLNGFISGTHYNRCKRLHPIISLALQLIHFKFFLQEENLQLTPDLVDELQEIQKRKMDSSGNILTDVDNFFLSEIIYKYRIFREKTRNGEHGKTAQFYMQYINLINYYFILSRSIRENNFELYKYVLPKITNIFFILNHPNYARWLTKHHDDILKVQDTHPGLEVHLQRHGLGIKRTDKAFSRQPVDLTLEQTINADAAKRLSGVSHFTNSLSGRQRWAKSHALRSTIITHVLEETNITKTQDVTSELQTSNIGKNKNAVQKLVDTIESYGNPFDYQDDKDELFNIVTGNSVTNESADFLLNIEATGENQRKEFISQCNENPDRFEKPIKRNEIRNFCLDKSKKPCKGAQKLQAIKAERNVFGRLLGISLNQKLDLPKVLEYPLTSLSPSMSHLDGSLIKTNKAALMKILETKADTNTPQAIDIVIVDGFYILHLIPMYVKTFGEMSVYILKKCMSYKAKRVDIIFDTYLSPSIKDSEREMRAGHKATSKTQYKITSPKQIRPSNFIKELRNTQFKEELVRFFIRHWSSEEAGLVISNSTVNLNFENNCYSYESDGKQVVQNDNPNLKCGNHEETDTKIIYHIYSIQEPSNVLIKTSDTDVIVILLGNLDKLEKHQIFIESGNLANRRVVNINKIYKSIGATLAKSLPAFHALTGCDYTPAFYRKGKQKPFNILSNNTNYQEALIELSCDGPLTNEIKCKIEQFICELYGVKSKSVNEARHNIFLKKFKPNKENEQFNKTLMNFDAAFLPPSEIELVQQILRAKYVSNIWMNSTKNPPSYLLPTEHGWKEENGKYVPLWYERNRLPDRVSDVTVTETENDNISGDVSDSSSPCLSSEDEDSEDDEI